MESGTKPRILVIRGGAIGDFILTLPAIKLLREAFPNAHLEILGYEHIISIADGRFYADGTRSIEYGAMAGFFVPNGMLADDLSAYFASFQQIVTYLFDPDGIFEANLRRAGAKNILPAYAKIDDSEHASLQLARPLQRLALYLDEAGATVFLSDEDQKQAERLLEPFVGRPLIGIHPGSGSARKNWPVEHWRELMGRIVSEPGGSAVVLVGGESDRVQISHLRDAFPSDSIAFEDLPLPTVAAVLGRCGLFLGHDSGISHLAAAVQTPAVLLFGPTDPEIWAPTNAGVTVVQAQDGDLGAIAVDEVFAAARPALQRLANARH